MKCRPLLNCRGRKTCFNFRQAIQFTGQQDVHGKIAANAGIFNYFRFSALRAAAVPSTSSIPHLK